MAAGTGCCYAAFHSLDPSLTPGAGQTEKLEGHNLISYKYTGGVFAERLTAARGAGPPGPGGVPLAPRDAETLLQRRQRRAQKKKPKRPPGTSPRTLPDIPSSGKVRPTALRTRPAASSKEMPSRRSGGKARRPPWRPVRTRSSEGSLSL